MDKKVRVAILDDHLPIVDGYVARLEKDPQIEITATMSFGEELEPTLKEHPADVLLLDVNVPASKENRNPYPILHTIPRLLQVHPHLNVLVISMHAERGLIRAVMEAGVNGYLLKDDQDTLKDLGSVVKSVSAGGIHFSPIAHDLYAKSLSAENNGTLTPRQREALSLCAAYPDQTHAIIAQTMNVEYSTVRNLLAAAYFKLGVSNKAAAIAKARELGLITPYSPEAPQ
jgi:two-component system, NarL family, nitrate/nitrite response regulator NarL